MTELDQIKKDLYGNGQKGLIKEFQEVKATQEHMQNDLSSLATSYSALVKMMTEHDTIEKTKMKIRERTLKTIGVLISIVSVAIVFLGLILKYN